MLAVITLLAGAVKAWRVFVPHVAGPTARLRVAYRAALDRMGELGFSRRFGESRERFARRTGSIAPSFEPLTGLHLRAALGGRGAVEGGVLHGLRGSMRSEIAGRVPGWRRLLGALNPFSWLWTR